ncbi:Serpentine Receptor, class H [Caenorhabditis elegans]|uniref:Serpentine Receptor, class H n=1 Tax=Caenorhabditis elegans TaxID=6239 RepID=Q7JKP7_CAEEL|nr:Serpentine Receptor, class H [Caenorhabditis elegans]CAE53738.2 Serpentine Receptor, class H [Caenorhabditis elegans]|eukprot:NP_001024100.2 Serpentine Receptor, class H [Caenorhabditis elegans]
MTTSTNLYYSNEWKKKCSNDSSFLASWQGLSVFSHSMCCYVDILICSLITPYFFFPTISGFPVGLLRVLKVPTSVQVLIGFISALFMAISLVALFENRSSAIQNNKFRITKKRWKLLYYSVNCFIVLVYLIPPYCNVPEQESAKLHLLQAIPCPTEEFFYSDVFVWTIDKFWINYLWMSTGVIVLMLFSQLGFFTICCIYYLYISTAIMISSNTRKFQRSFFLGTITQAVVPLIFLLLPVIIGIVVIYCEYYNQELNNSLVLFLSLHGFTSTFVIILVHHPYRRFLIKVVTFDRSAEVTGISYITKGARVDNNVLRRLPNRTSPYIRTDF